MMHLRAACISAAIVAAASSIAGAQTDFVAQANALYGSIRPDRRSDSLLLPVLGNMDAPPAGVATVEKARLAFEGSEAWAAAESWANAAPQRAVLEAIDKVSAEEDWRRAMAFGQGYGVEGIDPELVGLGMYTELGDPPMLAAGSFGWLPRLEWTACLVNVEAVRLASSGDVAKGVESMIDWAFFCRQMCDRELSAEAYWGYRHTTLAIERVRDIIYEAARDGHSIAAEDIEAIIERLDPEAGFMGIGRLKLPRADRLAAEQLVARTFVERAGPNPSTFAPTLSRIASRERPLQLFSEAARWDEAATRHKGWFDVTELIPKVSGDWESRWKLSPFDSRLKEPTKFEQADPVEYAVLHVAIKDLSRMFGERQVLWAELVGTRWSLAILGHYQRSKLFPPNIRTVVPTWLPRNEADPFNPARTAGAVPNLQYFVPIRDTRDQFGAREDPRPHKINVVTGDLNFDVSIDQDQFVMYSVGSDGGRNWAQVVQNTGEYVPNADYLIWPPMLSLTRQHQREVGVLK